MLGTTPALVLSLALFSTTLAPAADWTQWRGPDRDGSVPASAETPWPEGMEPDRLTTVWQAELNEGYSTPLVVGNKVFTVETEDKERERVRAFDRESGEQIWETTWEGAMKVPFFASKNGSWVRSTPAYSDGALYVAGMCDVLVCLDAETGDERWRVDFPADHGTPLPSFGYISSPLIDGDHLYIQAGCGIRRLDKETGELQWLALEDRRAMYGSAFSSPVFAEFGGERQLVVQTREKLAGLSPEDGELLWETQVKAFRLMNILTPVTDEAGVFTATYGGGFFRFDVAEMGGAYDVAQSWNDDSGEGYMCSPVVVGGNAYLLGRDRHFYCVDPTGVEGIRWKSDEKFGDYWSLVTDGERILALDSDGEILLIEPDPAEFRVVGRAELEVKNTWAHLVICGREIYVRDLRGIRRLDWE